MRGEACSSVAAENARAPPAARYLAPTTTADPTGMPHSPTTTPLSPPPPPPPRMMMMPIPMTAVVQHGGCGGGCDGAAAAAAAPCSLSCFALPSPGSAPDGCRSRSFQQSPAPPPSTPPTQRSMQQTKMTALSHANASGRCCRCRYSSSSSFPRSPHHCDCHCGSRCGCHCGSRCVCHCG